MRGKYLVAFMLLYICGTVCHAIGFSDTIIYTSALAVFVCVLAAKNRKSLAVIAVFSLCFAAGYLRMEYESKQYDVFENVFAGRYVTVFGTVDDVPEKTESAFSKNITYPVKISQLRVNDKFYKTDKKIMVYAPENATVNMGDTVILKGILKLPEEDKNPGGFNYRSYLKTQKTAAVINIDEGVVCGNSDSAAYKIKSIRNRLLNKISQCMPQNTDLIVRALVLGDKSLLGDDVETAFAGSGISHALALSGMHLSILTAFVMWFISKSRMHMRLRALVCIAAVIVYIPVAGFFPSLMRAGIMTLFALFATLFKRRYDTATAIVFAATVLIAQNPYVINSVSFQLSFFATAGIVYIALPLYAVIKRKVSLNRLAAFVVITTVSSLCATLVTLPVIAKTFGYISIYTILGNLVIVPLIEVLFAGGIVMIALSVVFMPAAKLVGFALAAVTYAIVFISDGVSSLPGAFFNIKAPGIPEYLLYASSLVSVALCLKCGKFKKSAVIPVVVCAVLCVANNIYQATVFRVEFINVGQGDGALVQIPFGKNIMIDCGPENGQAANYIRTKGIHTLDVVYLSHTDSDHLGGLEQVLSSVNVKKVVLPHTSAKTKDISQILSKILKSGADVEFADDNYKCVIGSCTVEAVHPGMSTTDDDNANSLVLKISCRGKKFLFTGDINTESENIILQSGKNIDADVMKIAHHGSKNSTGAEFTEKVSPRYAVISALKNNSYGHPDRGVLDRLQKANCRVLRTDINGYVHFSKDIFGNFKIKVKNLE